MEVEGMLLLFYLGVIIVSATALAFLARLFKQPPILAYVLAGIIIGPAGLQLVPIEDIKIFAELGIAFLLFFVGLELDIKRLRNVGKVSVGCGLGQIFFTFLFGFALGRIIGFSQMESFYIAFALTISSTMVVIKLLSDKRELNTLHGKIVLGTLLVQDIATIMVLAALPTISGFSISTLTTSILIGFGLISIAIFSSKYFLAPFVKYAAKSVELLFLFALSWCFIFSLFASLLNFSIAIGAFLAGVSLASFPYNLEITGRVRSLRDFFATIFFVSLGMQVPLKINLFSEILVFSLFVLVGGAVIMFFITSLYGYGKRVSFLTSISLAQISEFSLILATQGLLLGHISPKIFSLIAWVALITITISSYFIIHSSRLYRVFVPFLGFFDKVSRKKELESIPKSSKEHTVVCGCHRTGYNIVKLLRKLKKNFLVLDYNPEIIKNLMSQGINCIYGDIEDLEILERIDLKHANLVISTIPDHEDNLLLLKQTKELNPGAFIILRAESIDNAIELYEKGANYVLFPEMLSGEKASDFLKIYYKNKYLCMDSKQKEMEKLEKIKEEEILIKYEHSLLKYWREKGFKL